MAAGSKKVKVTEIRLSRGNPVMSNSEWQLFIEDNTGQDVFARGGMVITNHGTPAVALAKTLSAIQNEVLAQVAVDAGVPARDTIT